MKQKEAKELEINGQFWIEAIVGIELTKLKLYQFFRQQIKYMSLLQYHKRQYIQ